MTTPSLRSLTVYRSVYNVKWSTDRCLGLRGTAAARPAVRDLGQMLLDQRQRHVDVLARERVGLVEITGPDGLVKLLMVFEGLDHLLLGVERGQSVVEVVHPVSFDELAEALVAGGRDDGIVEAVVEVDDGGPGHGCLRGQLVLLA